MDIDDDNLSTSLNTTANDLDNDPDFSCNMNLLSDDLIEYTQPESGSEIKVDKKSSGDKIKGFEDEISNASTSSVVKTIALTTASATVSSTGTPKTIIRVAPSQNVKMPIKIAAKPTAAVAPCKFVKSPNGRQIMVIQNSSGNAHPVRLTGVLASGTASGSSGPFQFIKTSDGNIIQIRKKETTTVPNVGSGSMLSSVTTAGTMKKVLTAPVQKIQSAANSQGKLIYKGISVKGNESQIMLSTPPTSRSTMVLNTSTAAQPNVSINNSSTTKTLSLSEAQKLGILGSAKIKHIVVSRNNELKSVAASHTTTTAVRAVPKLLPAPATSPSINTPTAQVLTNAVKKVTPIQPKVPMQVVRNISPKKITQMQSIKVQSGLSSAASGSSATTSSYQQVHIPGKGVQYIRFVSMNQTPTSNTTTTVSATQRMIPTTKLVQSMPVTSSGGATSQHKILIHGKSGQTVALLQQPSSSGGATHTNAVSTTTLVNKKIITVNKSQILNNNIQQSKSVVELNKTLPKIAPLCHNTKTDGNEIQRFTVVRKGIKNSIKTQPSKIVMLPTTFVQQLQNKTIQLNADGLQMSPIKIKEEVIESSEEEEDEDFINKRRDSTLASQSMDDDGSRRRACNCTRSQCLKLYCDCFANGEFCANCNCRDCFNTLENEGERQKAIRICLERNPNAFRPKIGKAKDHDLTLRRHNKGCNCKRSGCLKNYCECYEAKISCTGNCRCVGCRNTDDFSSHDQDGSGNVSYAGIGTKRKSMDSMEAGPSKDAGGPTPSKQPYNFMTPDVIDATVQCMVAQAEECQRRGTTHRIAEKLILGEFGRCLKEIIDFSV